MKNSTIGIISLCFGLIGFFSAYWYIGIIPCVIGIILGIVGLMDYLAYKWSSVIGLACSGLGILLFIYAVVTDIDAGNLIIACDKGDFVYVSNVDESNALNEYAEILASAQIKAAQDKKRDSDDGQEAVTVDSAANEERRDSSAENTVVVDKTADNTANNTEAAAATSNSYVKGTNYGTYWESEWLRMRYDQPSGFTMLPDSQLPDPVFELVVMSSSGMPNFNLSVEQSDNSVGEYVSITGQQLQSIYGAAFTDRGFESTEEIGGKYFEKYTYEVSDGGSTMYQVLYITKKDDYIVNIVLTYTEETKGEADTLLSGFSEL